MPHTRRSQNPSRPAQSGGLRAFPICPALELRAFKAVIDRLKPRYPTPPLF
jgi:hypothetical protein